MTFSVLFWNVWLDNQINGAAGATRLLNEIKRIVNTHKPDIIGLNEVLQSKLQSSPFILDLLEQQGYTYNDYAPASPLNENWMIGTALCSRHKLSTVNDVVISKDTPAEKRGYPNCGLKAITTTVTMPGDHSLNIIVAHPMHLRKHTLKDHYEGTANLERLIRSKEFSKNTILGGDFNEPGFMPKAFKSTVSDIMEFRTGSTTKPTWHHNAHRFTLKEFEVLNTRVSDHRPIFATFEY